MRQTRHRPLHDPVQLALVALANPNKSAVLVVGPPGSGKSRVLSEVRSQLSGPSAAHPDTTSGPPVVRPTDGTHDLALSALLPAVPRIPQPGDGADVPARPGRAASGERRLLAIDDLDLLDSSSLSLLAQSLDREAIRLVGAVRTSESAKVLQTLRPVRPLAIVRIQPWRRDDVAAFIARQIGGVLHELTLCRLLRFSGGNALCLTELLDSGLASGRLRRHYDTWVWTGSLTVQPLTAARVASRLDDLDPTGRDVLATVALVGVAELQLLEEVFGSAAVEAADDAGLLSIEQSDLRLVVSPRSSIEGSVLLQTLSATRRRRLAGAFVAALERHGCRRADDPLRMARLLSLAGIRVSPELSLKAASVALRRHDPEFAEVVLAQHPGDDPAATSLLVSALVAQGRQRQAAAVLANALRETSMTAGDRAELRTRMALLELLDASAEPARRFDSHLAVTDRSTVCRSAWTGRDLGDAAAVGRTLGRQRDWSGTAVQQALVGAVAALAQAGKLDAAVEAAGAAGDCLSERFAFEPTEWVHLLTVLGSCQLERGAVEDADRCATALRQAGRAQDWSYAYELGALLGGRCALARGSVRRASRLLSESLAPGKADRAAFLRPYGLTLLALAQSLAGGGGSADRALFDADRATLAGTPRLLRELTQLARAEILLARGLRRGAFEAAIGVADRSQPEGQILAGLSALHLCIRIQPSPEIADRVALVVRDTDFTLARLYRQHAESAVARDGRAMSDVAAAYDRMGLRWLAAETAAASLAATPPSHRASWVTADRSILERVDAQADIGLPAPWWQSGDGLAPLTQREREITELAAGGWSSPRIATHLHLSKRTVENHLQHSYRKLGISHREELATVLGRTATGR